jgi:hypothetical protein
MPFKEDAMKRMMKKLEDIMVAITFAEAGEFDTAMEMSGDNRTTAKGIYDSETDAKDAVVEHA